MDSKFYYNSKNAKYKTCLCLVNILKPPLCTKLIMLEYIYHLKLKFLIMELSDAKALTYKVMEEKILKKVDLNCDMGESFGRYTLGEQQDILKYVTSANIACGFHAGDPSVMKDTVKFAIEKGVRIGAHPGLPDLVGFGRREMTITPREAYDMVVYQIGALQGFLTVHNEKMQHVKPHGGLYNMAAKDKELAAAIAQAVYDVSPSLVLFGLAGSQLTKAGERLGLTTAHEVFADRTYQRDGTLTSRSEADALITDQDESVAQVVKMVTKGSITSQQNIEVPLKADTICIHGDGAHALDFAKYINQSLKENGIVVSAILN